MELKDINERLRNRWVLLAVFILLLPLSVDLADRLGQAGMLNDLPSIIAWMVAGLLGFWLITRPLEGE